MILQYIVQQFFYDIGISGNVYTGNSHKANVAFEPGRLACLILSTDEAHCFHLLTFNQMY